MRKQWYPLFAQLLRPLVEDYYQIETNVPVGDLPRAADIVLLRRRTDRLQAIACLPFLRGEFPLVALRTRQAVSHRRLSSCA